MGLKGLTNGHTNCGGQGWKATKQDVTGTMGVVTAFKQGFCRAGKFNTFGWFDVDTIAADEPLCDSLSSGKLLTTDGIIRDLLVTVVFVFPDSTLSVSSCSNTTALSTFPSMFVWGSNVAVNGGLSSASSETIRDSTLFPSLTDWSSAEYVVSSPSRSWGAFSTSLMPRLVTLVGSRPLSWSTVTATVSAKTPAWELLGASVLNSSATASLVCISDASSTSFGVPSAPWSCCAFKLKSTAGITSASWDGPPCPSMTSSQHEPSTTSFSPSITLSRLPSLFEWRRVLSCNTSASGLSFAASCCLIQPTSTSLVGLVLTTSSSHMVAWSSKRPSQHCSVFKGMSFPANLLVTLARTGSLPTLVVHTSSMTSCFKIIETSLSRITLSILSTRTVSSLHSSTALIFISLCTTSLLSVPSDAGCSISVLCTVHISKLLLPLTVSLGDSSFETELQLCSLWREEPLTELLSTSMSSKSNSGQSDVSRCSVCGLELWHVRLNCFLTRR